VTFQLADQKVMSRMTLSEIEKLLPSFFIRTHRSFLANKLLITKVEKHQLHIKGFPIPVSSSYIDQVMEKLKI
jgi:DNA-binding LytR/AlgR family response regulator